MNKETILNRIVEYKTQEVAEARKHTSEQALMGTEYFARACFNLNKNLFDSRKNGIISEYKRASPSKGLINGHSSIEDVVRGYESAGVAAISVLTDGPSFKGNLEDLRLARKAVQLPILRKDFVVDLYQILEAKAHGADIVLLIASILEPSQIDEFSQYAKDLGLSVLLEVHTASELSQNLWTAVDAIGVNNRNLHDFSVSIDHSLELVRSIPDQYAKISESGISNPKLIRQLRQAGFHGFLIGENFMKTNDPAIAIRDFVQQLRSV